MSKSRFPFVPSVLIVSSVCAGCGGPAGPIESHNGCSERSHSPVRCKGSRIHALAPTRSRTTAARPRSSLVVGGFRPLIDGSTLHGTRQRHDRADGSERSTGPVEWEEPVAADARESQAARERRR
jgi:hypothetical protein